MERFTLRDMLAQESLGLRLVTPEDDAALDAPVMGAHGTEALHPVPWMSRGWALLLTGVRLVDRPDRQRELVRELAEGGLAALGFGTGIDFETVPPAVVETAREHGFPVFEIPLRTPFREIIAYVNRSLLSTDLHYLRRVTSMREFLLDSLQHPEPAETVVQRTASLLDGSAALFTRDGRPEHAVGPIPPAELWEAVRSFAAGEEVTPVRGRVPGVAAVRDHDVVQRWLVVAPRTAPASATYAAPLIDTATMLLAGLAGLRRITEGHERAVRATFVSDLLSGRDEEQTIWQHRAADLGLAEPGQPLRGLVVTAAAGAGADGGPAGGERLLAEVDAVLAGTEELTTVLALRQEAVYGVIRGPREALAGRLDELARRDMTGTIGVGRAVERVAALRESLRDAERAARRPAGAGPPEDRARWFEDLDLLSWALTTSDEAGLQAKARAVLAPLREDEVLLSSLVSYLDHNMNAVKAARSMSVHPNSLRYRLARIEERLGRSLQEPETISLLHTAVRVLDERPAS